MWLPMQYASTARYLVWGMERQGKKTYYVRALTTKNTPGSSISKSSIPQKVGE